MTFLASRRVIEQVSLLRRFALLAGVALASALPSPASAQVPVFVPRQPEPSAAPTPAGPLPPPAAPVPPPAELAPVAAEDPLPPPAAAPVSRPAPAPLPAKTDYLAPAGAPAEPPAVDDEPYVDVGPRRRWYGWQTLVADGASLLLIVAGARAQDQLDGDSGDTLVTIGLLGYGLAPGIIHFAHGNTGRGFASFGMRLGMPLAGAFLGAATASGCDGFECEAGGAALGLLLGMGGAMAIDAAVFAYDDAEPVDEARLVPLVALAPQAAWLGLGGRL